MNTGNVNQSLLKSPLMEAMRLNPRKGGAKRKKLVATLILTSLVDAFSIMLLYLLVQNTGNGSTIELTNATKLPVAVQSTALHDGTLVRLSNGKMFLGNEEIPAASLAARLQEELRKLVAKGNTEPALIFQADRDSDTSGLINVIRAGSVSGFHTFKFAVLQDGGQS
jgi:biopolymer transport protein ExbD